MQRRLVVGLMPLLACAEPQTAVVVEPDACGDRPGMPTRIAALSPDERLDRIVNVGGQTRAVFEIGHAPPHAAGTPPPPFEPSRLISTDACGAEPLPLPGTTVVGTTDDAIVTCDETSGDVVLVAVDASPQWTPLLSAVGCAVLVADSHALALLGGEPPLSVGAVPLTGGDVVTLVAAVAAIEPPPVAVADDRLFALSQAGRLSTIDIVARTTLATQEEVADVRVSPDGDFVLTQRGVPDRHATPSTVTLLHRESGRSVPLTETSLSWSPTPWFHDWVLLAVGPGQPHRIFERTTGAEVVLPPTMVLRGRADGTRLWLGRSGTAYGELEEYVWEPGEREPEAVVIGEGFATSGGDDGLFVHLPSDALGIQLGTLLRIGWSGGEHEVVAERIGWHRRRLPDGGWLSVVADATGDRGTLVEHLADGARRELDEGVHVFTPSLSRNRQPQDALVYAVRDGPHSGVYRLTRDAQD